MKMAKPKIIWSLSAKQDIERLYHFLHTNNPRRAAYIRTELIKAPRILQEHPRIGQKIEQIVMNDVRRLIVEEYEIRYEVTPDRIHILRIWHGREDR